MDFVVKAVKKLSLNEWGSKFLAIFPLTIWLAACTDAPKESSLQSSQDTLYAIPWEEVQAYMKAAPSPLQVAAWLKQEKVSFIREALHDPTLATKYGGIQGAATLGIYLTDMAYAYSTQHYQEAYEYLSSVNRLAARYGVDDILSVDRIRLLEKLQDRPDSAQKLLSQYYGEMQQRLEETGQQVMLRHMILGGWIESLHLTLALLEKEPQKQQLAEMITLQKSLIPLLIKLYSIDTAATASSRQVIQHLLSIQESINTVVSESTDNRPVTKVEKGVIQMQFTSKATGLSAQQLHLLKRPVSELRQYMIKV